MTCASKTLDNPTEACHQARKGISEGDMTPRTVDVEQDEEMSIKLLDDFVARWMHLLKQRTERCHHCRSRAVYAVLSITCSVETTTVSCTDPTKFMTFQEVQLAQGEGSTVSLAVGSEQIVVPAGPSTQAVNSTGNFIKANEKIENSKARFRVESERN